MQLLRLKEAKTASRYLDGDTLSYLEVYSQGMMTPMASVERDLDDPQYALEGDALWDTGSGTYNDWICKLGYALIMRTKTNHLRVCAQMVAMLRCLNTFLSNCMTSVIALCLSIAWLLICHES